MRKLTIVPRDVARDFKISEAFFSCTDERGIILAGNRVFCRISGYTEAELVGRPHNIIRHPDMPRAVFKLLWDTLEAGEPICAYVKNMAKDGAYYWVLALAAPMPGGYISVRFKSSSPLLALVESVYRDMRAIEIAAEERGASGADAMAEATQFLVSALQSHGFADYRAFMRTALLREELVSRDAAIAAQGLPRFSDLPVPPTDTLAGALYRACRSSRDHYTLLQRHLSRLDEIAQLDRELRAGSQQILRQAADIGMVAFNVAFRASKLGHEGQGVAVIADYLNQSSMQIGGLVKGIATRVSSISERLARVVFDLGWLRLQYEMAVIYEHEIATELGPESAGLDASALAVRWRMLASLGSAFDGTGTRAVRELQELAREVRGISGHAEELDRIIMGLKVARVSGLVESSRLESDAFRVIFAQLEAQIDCTMQEMHRLNASSQRLQALAADAPRIGADISRAGQQLAHDGAEFEKHAADVATATGGGTELDDDRAAEQSRAA